MPSATLLAILLLNLLSGLLVAAAVTDIRSRTIANGLNLAVALLAVPWWWCLGYTWGSVVGQLCIAVGILVIFAGCFALGMMGGGDVKLLAALGLWLPLGELTRMLVWMALGGGILTLFMLLRHRRSGAETAIEVPYGVAISAAALLTVANHILTIRAA